MRTIKLTEVQYDLLKEALDSSPVMEAANHEDPKDPALGLWRACAEAETDGES